MTNTCQVSIEMDYSYHCIYNPVVSGNPTELKKLNLVARRHPTGILKGVAGFFVLFRFSSATQTTNLPKLVTLALLKD